MAALTERQKNKMRIELSSQKSEMALNKGQMKEVCEAAAKLGVHTLKLVGKDPLSYSGLAGLVRELKKINNIWEVSLTTDGFGLAEQAKKLAVSGLDRVNINIDTFKYMKYGKGNLDDVVAGINAATDAGLKPVKLNVVMKKEYNDDELMDFVQLTFQHQYEIRFIEMTEEEEACSCYKAMLCAEIKEKLPVLRPAIVDDEKNILDDPRDGTADVYKYPGARGKICFIAKRAEDFASRCAGLYLTKDGILKQEQNDDGGVDLLPFLQERNAEKLEDIIRSVLGETEA